MTIISGLLPAMYTDEAPEFGRLSPTSLVLLVLMGQTAQMVFQEQRELREAQALMAKRFATVREYLHQFLALTVTFTLTLRRILFMGLGRPEHGAQRLL